MKAWLIPAIAVCLSTGCTNGDFRKVELSKVVANPRAFNGQVVTLCGWATNQFEDVNLTVNRGARKWDAGLAVEWCDDAPETTRATYAYVSGTVEPAWGMTADAADGHPASLTDVVVSTGSAFSWAIRQSCRHLHDAS